MRISNARHPPSDTSLLSAVILNGLGNGTHASCFDHGAAMLGSRSAQLTDHVASSTLNFSKQLASCIFLDLKNRYPKNMNKRC